VPAAVRQSPLYPALVGQAVTEPVVALDGHNHVGLVVRVRILHDAVDTIIEVADTGPGIPPDVRELVFTDGWSTKQAAPDRPRGTGLALVAQLARRLGGDVSVASTAAAGAGGAVLRVRFPGEHVPASASQ